MMIKKYNEFIREFVETGSDVLDAKMQEIKRNISTKKYQGCAESTRLLYVDAMTTNVDAYLEFMKGEEHEIQAATLMTDYEKQLEMAEREQKNCAILQ